MDSTSVSYAKMENLVKEMVDRQKRQAADLLLSVAGVAAFYNGYIEEMPDITPIQEEAFELAFPNMELADAVGNMGMINAWKGKIFELEIQDRLNGGETIGGITLEPGQEAVLAESATQEGWDLQILNENGDVATEIQAKATETYGYAKDALVEGRELVTTNDLQDQAAQFETWHVVDGVSEQDIEGQLEVLVQDSVMGEVLGTVFPLAAIAISKDKEASAAAIGAGVAASALLPIPSLTAMAITFGVRAWYSDERKREGTLEVLETNIKALENIKPRMLALPAP